MHNITTAVRRLSFAPAPRDMKVTDVKKGHFVFTPQPARPVSWKELHEEVVKAGYDILGTAVTVRGSLTADGHLRSTGTGQIFTLTGPAVGKLRAETAAEATLTLSGAWRLGPAGESIEVERWEAGR